MVAMSPARPPAPLGSLALKLITQAGADGSCVASPVSVGVSGAGVMNGVYERSGLRRQISVNL